MDLHHRDPEDKVFALSDASSRAVAQIIEEIEKCDLICANCHRMRHGV
jgi:hypothetical protein